MMRGLTDALVGPCLAGAATSYFPSAWVTPLSDVVRGLANRSGLQTLIGQYDPLDWSEWSAEQQATSTGNKPLDLLYFVAGFVDGATAQHTAKDIVRAYVAGLAGGPCATGRVFHLHVRNMGPLSPRHLGWYTSGWSTGIGHLIECSEHEDDDEGNGGVSSAPGGHVSN